MSSIGSKTWSGVTWKETSFINVIMKQPWRDWRTWWMNARNSKRAAGVMHRKVTSLAVSHFWGWKFTQCGRILPRSESTWTTQARVLPPQHNTEYVSRELPLLQSAPAWCPRTVTEEDVLGGTGFPGSCRGNRAQAGVGQGGRQRDSGLEKDTHPLLQEALPLFCRLKCVPEDYGRFRKLMLKVVILGLPAFSSFWREGLPLGGGARGASPSAPGRSCSAARPLPHPSGCLTASLLVDLSYFSLSLPFLIFSYMLFFFLSERGGSGRRTLLPINRETFLPGASQSSRWQPAPSG